MTRDFLPCDFCSYYSSMIHTSIYESSIPIKHANCLSDKISICILVVPELTKIRWWIKNFCKDKDKDNKFWCKDGWKPDSVIKFRSKVNIRSMHEEEYSNIYVGSLITWWKPNCDEIFSIALPAIVVTSFLRQLLDLSLKSPSTTTKEELFCKADANFSSRFSLKDSNWSCDSLVDLQS